VRNLRVATTLAAIRAAIKWRGVRAAMRLAVALSKIPSLRVRPTLEPSLVVARVQSIARRMPFRADCLPQSLTSWVELQRSGFTPTVRLGIALDDDPSAHAWVELDGVALCDSTVHRYNAFQVDEQLPRAVVGAGR
jgi:hypothetical protein